jgi:hypothetical protein
MEIMAIQGVLKVPSLEMDVLGFIRTRVWVYLE